MITLHSLSKITTKRAKRRGRGLGSGKGSKSGRGTTRHQTARTDIPLHFEGGQGRIVKKYPLLRGKSKNNSIVRKPYALALSKLLIAGDVDVITLEKLQELSLIPVSARSVKVVFDKNIDRAIKIRLPVTANARNAIQKAGGSVE